MGEKSTQGNNCTVCLTKHCFFHLALPVLSGSLTSTLGISALLSKKGNKRKRSYAIEEIPGETVQPCSSSLLGRRIAFPGSKCSPLHPSSRIAFPVEKVGSSILFFFLML